jgi:hypothetical protein
VTVNGVAVEHELRPDRLARWAACSPSACSVGVFRRRGSSVRSVAQHQVRRRFRRRPGRPHVADQSDPIRPVATRCATCCAATRCDVLHRAALCCNVLRDDGTCSAPPWLKHVSFQPGCYESSAPHSPSSRSAATAPPGCNSAARLQQRHAFACRRGGRRTTAATCLSRCHRRSPRPSSASRTGRAKARWARVKRARVWGPG